VQLGQAAKRSAAGIGRRARPGAVFAAIHLLNPWVLSMVNPILFALFASFVALGQLVALSRRRSR
jgi:hypothetical protein